VKTKLKSHIQVVQDGKDKVIAKDDVFQIDELVDAYRVVSSTDLEENLNSLVTKNVFLLMLRS
jgi:hypothetical protein